jgi:hypothetical protein
MNKSWKISNPLLISISVACSIVYYVFAYHLERSSFNLLLALYSVLFVGYIFLISSDFKYKFALGLLFRAILIFQIPNLSQDFYRFIWDGRLMVSDLNPYLFIPVDIVDRVFDGQFLISKMGDLSAHNYSNYPPLNQLIFAIGAFLSPKNLLGNVLVLRILIVLADIGIYIFGRKILEFLNLEKEKIHYYFLNPLVIIELTGNLHFEGVMMCFFGIGIFYFFKNRIFLAATFIAFSILTKLLPLIMLPLFLKHTPKYAKFYLIILCNLIIAFLPFFTYDFLQNYTNTIGLWFTKFEFNASFYYLIRSIGYFSTGYNIISIYGWVSPIIIIFTITYLAFKTQAKNPYSLLNSMLVCVFIYFIVSTTIHPWYLITLIFINIFQKEKYILLWSFTIFLSYSAYQTTYFKESMILIFLEYSVVFLLIILGKKTFLNNKI